MTPNQGASQNPERLGEGPRLLSGVFSLLERLAYQRPLWVVLTSLALAVLSIWITVSYLEFNTSRRDLIAKDLEYEELYEQYRSKFQDFDGITLVIEGDQPDQMKAFAHRFADALKDFPALYSEIFFKIDVEYFKDKGLLFMTLPELRDLADKLKSHRDFLDEINAAPGLNQFLRSINSQISSGMVDTLMAGFLGSESDSDSADDSDETDLSLLIAVLKQMNVFLGEEPRYRSPWRSFLSNRGETLEEEGYLVSDDESLMFFLINPNETANDFAGSKDSIDTIRQLVADLKKDFPGLNVGVTGSDVIASDEMATTQVDVKDASIIALIGVTALFIVVFRGVVHPLLAVASLVVALCWAMGFTTVSVGHLNILSVVFTTILIGLGIDFGIHVLERYREERRQGKDILASLNKTLQGTGRGNLAGAITTAIAFLAMTFTDFIGIAELGWIAGGGILLCLIAMILLLPALITLQERLKVAPTTSPSPVVAKSDGTLESVFRHYPWIIGCCVALIALSFLGFRDLRFDYNLLHLQAEGTEAVQYELKILDKARRSTWYAAIISPSLDDALEKIKTLKSIPSVGKVESIVSAIPEKQDEKLQFLITLAPVVDELEVAPEDEPLSMKSLVKTVKKIRFKLRGREEKDKNDQVAEAGRRAEEFVKGVENMDADRARAAMEQFSEKLFEDYRAKIRDIKKGVQTTPVVVKELPENLLKRFTSPGGEYLVMVYPNIDIWEREAMAQFLEDIRGIDPKVTGNAVHMFESSQLMKAGYIHGGLYAMVAIIIFLLVSFKSLRTTGLILLPTLVGTVWTVGVMQLIGVQFNLANLVILPLIIGIGVVNGIHIVNRYREEPDKNVIVLSKSTGQAVVLSSLTTMIGFGSLMIADHQGIYSLGLVLTLGVGNSLLASVTLLPALLKLCAVKNWPV